MKTVPVGMYSLATDQSVPWGLFAAGALMLLVPIMFLFAFLQRFLESGLTLGGVKGETDEGRKTKADLSFVLRPASCSA
jgi:arabinogalactan oligomer/maltooligosaccharide transport system permease protein